MNSRIITTSEKKIVLDRDGWCCNRCGYVPFHTFDNVPWWAKQDYSGLCSFAHDIESQPPVIFVNWERESLSDPSGIHYIFNWLHGGELEFDHIIPVRFGGLLELGNVQALCHDCHRIKTNMELRYTETTKYSLHKFMGQLCKIP